MQLSKILEEENNVALHLSDEQLTKIGEAIVAGYDIDLDSRSGWEKDIKQYLKLALQVVEDKTFPWAGASNVKYPMIATAAAQFAARAYPTLVPATGNLVHVAIVSAFADEAKQQRAKNVGRYMSYQILNEMYDWEEGMDNLLLILAIFGIAYKKVYYSPDRQTNCSELVNPFNLVVNYWAKELCNCPRITEVLYKSGREIEEKKRAKLYLDIDLGAPQQNTEQAEAINVSKNAAPPGEVDETTPYMLLEQHTFLDLDEDGYSEPYIVLVDYFSKKVLRIMPRFTEDSVETSGDEIIKITPDDYYVKYSFFPSPDGSFYTRGFGHLLGPLNESVNTVLNQLIDAGTMSNLQSGFIGKGLKIRQGDHRFKPGEWKQVNTLGSDIKSNVFPLPTREPSNVLFQLLGMLVQAGKELASVAEIFVGKMPGQNTPAFTTQQSIEQGMKLFTAIYKRVYRSLTKEFRLLYKLNARYLDVQFYQAVVDDPQASEADFEQDEKDVLPNADPQASSEFDKQQRYQQVGNLLQLGTIEKMEFTKQMLRSFGFDEEAVKKLTEGSPATQPPQPDPEQQKMQMEAGIKQQEAQQKMQVEQAKLALKQREAEFKLALEQQKAVFEQKQQAMQLQFDQLRNQLDLMARDASHKQKLNQQAQKAATAATRPTKQEK